MSDDPPPELPGSRFAGMTTNERLFVGGLLDSWQRAARIRDRQTMIKCLLRVDVTEWHAIKITDAVLANPAMYGF
jgi:hypothetical protein